jgi:hypothetical protein
MIEPRNESNKLKKSKIPKYRVKSSFYETGWERKEEGDLKIL